MDGVGRPLPAILQRRLPEALVRLGAVRWAGHRLVRVLVDAQPPRELLAQLPMAYSSSSSTGDTTVRWPGSAAAGHLVMTSGGHYLHYTDPETVVEIARRPHAANPAPSGACLEVVLQHEPLLPME